MWFTEILFHAKGAEMLRKQPSHHIDVVQLWRVGRPGSHIESHSAADVRVAAVAGY